MVGENVSEGKGNSIYDFSAQTSVAKDISMSEYADKVVLIVNTASKCGLTPQFEGLEALYKKYKDQGLVILGFPCGQFANQELKSDEEIQSFCQVNYGVSFPVFSKVDVNGSSAHPLFKYLKDSLPGLMGIKTIKWNFTKFLVNKEGQPVKRFAPTDVPENIEKDIQALL